MNFFPSSCRVFVTSSSKSALVRGSVVNLLIYLADQLLKGYQFVDNQFQALQNQATKGIFGLWFPGFRSKKPKWHNFKRFGVLRFCFPLLFN
jgi:hypothetical protein